MLQHLISLRPAVHAVCRLEETLRPYVLSATDWKLLEQLTSMLEIFVKATEHLSGSTYPTLSSQLPYFVVLAGRLEKYIDEMRVKESTNEILFAVNDA